MVDADERYTFTLFTSPANVSKRDSFILAYDAVIADAMGDEPDGVL